MNEYRPGAENIPLREINKDLQALIIVYDLRNEDRPIVEKRINYGDADDRRWLGRITFWAMTNHCSVETMAVSDAEAETMENK